jgi:choline dehydrogenase
VFIPALASPHGRDTLTGHGISLHACHLYPQSTGPTEAGQRGSARAHRIDPNYLDHEEDVEVMTDCLEIARDLLLSDAFDGEFDQLDLPADPAPAVRQLTDEVRAARRDALSPHLHLRDGERRALGHRPAMPGARR